MMKTVTQWSRAKGPLRVVDTNPLEAQSAVSIVATAAAILREELQSVAANTAGPLSPVLGAVALVPGLAAEQRGGQVQSLVEALSRLVNLPPGQLTQLIDRTPVAIPATDASGYESVRVLHPSRPVAAGDVARVLLRLENDDTEPDECALCVTDLIGPPGHRIPAAHVRISPQPARIPAGGSVDIQIEVRIPSGTPGGCYAGLLQTDDGEALRALVQVRVNP